MEILLYLFVVQEANGLRGRPDSLPASHFALLAYRTVFSGLLFGGERLRIRGRVFNVMGPRGPISKEPGMMFTDVAPLFRQIRLHDARVRAVLEERAPNGADEATYAFVCPPDLDREFLECLNERVERALIVAAEHVPPIPGFEDRAIRVILSETAAERGYRFPAERPPPNVPQWERP